MLDRVADLLEEQHENPFRIGSYRKAARTVRESDKPVGKLVRLEGPDGLRAMGNIGDKLGGLIQEYVSSGKVKLLEELEANAPPASAKKTGQKERVSPAPHVDLPVDLILSVDEEYRKSAKTGKLKMIAPKKLNPEGKAWLPLLSTQRAGWKFTVMFSNTARAHELGKTNDWVVVYYERGGPEGQCTVVTEQKGVLKGKRVIRGREEDCRKFYDVR